MNLLHNKNSIYAYELGDKRLNKRLGKIVKKMQVSVESSTPQVMGDRGQTKGYYRFINNKKVESSALIAGYSLDSRTCSLASASTLLAIQDTTSLHYSTNRAAPNLDCLETDISKGFMLHNHLLISDNGIPLGLFSQSFFARKAEDLGKSKANTRKKTPIEAKESYRWLEEFNALQEAYKDATDKTIVQICDREADIHELLEARKYTHIHYLIRSSYERASADRTEASIWAQVEAVPFSYAYELVLPATNKRTSTRTATMEVRYKYVTINPGYRKGYKLKAQGVWILETKEVSPVPEGDEAIHWRLLTSIPILTKEIAATIIRYYVLRWLIERFHYVLKQGLKVEDLQIETPQALQNAIVLKSWQAIDVMILHAYTQIDTTITLQEAGFSQKDYEIAFQYAKKCCNSKEVKQTAPTVKHFTRLIAQIGGHSLQVSKPIGVVAIWRGWTLFGIIKKVILSITIACDEDVGK